MGTARTTGVRLVNTAASLGLAGVLAACGGGGSSSSPSPSTTAAPVSADRAAVAVRSSGLPVCNTTQGGEAPGIGIQATSRLSVDCPAGTRGVSIFSFDDPNVAYAVAGGGVAGGDDMWLVGSLAVAGVNLTPSERSSFDRAMRSLGAHRYQGA